MMKNLLVLVPEGYYVNYYVYSSNGAPQSGSTSYHLQRKGRIRSRDSSASSEDLRSLTDEYRPGTVAVRILYGGERFRKPTLYDSSMLPALEELIPESPLHIPLAVRIIKTLERSIPVPDILLLFETSFFANLPVQERTYALDPDASVAFGGALEGVRRFGYHGIYHEAACRRITRRHREVRRIVSVCLEPVPEVVGIYDGKPVFVSGGSTPMEGIPGNTTCGDIDPGIVLLIEEKLKLGPELINEMLGRNSGLTALAGKNTTIEDIFDESPGQRAARELFEYRVLLSCGSAIANMDGFDAVAFSGRYSSVAERLWKKLGPRLAEASWHKQRRGLRGRSAPDEPKPVFYLRDSLDRIIAEDCCAPMFLEEPAGITTPD